MKLPIILLLLVFLLFAQSKAQSIHETINEYIQNGEFEKAEQIALQEISNFPKDPETICALACVYRNQSLKEILNVDASAMGIKDGESGTYQIKDSTNLKRLFKSNTAIDTVVFAKAEKWYFRIIALDSSYLNAYFNLLNTYIEIPDFKKYFKTIDLFIENLSNEPDSKSYLSDLARKLMAKGYYDETIQLYEKALHHYPDFIEAKSDIGAVKFNQGKIIQAKQIFEEVWEKTPDDLLNLNNYFSALLFCEDFSTAFKIALELIEKDSLNQENYLDAGMLSILVKKNSEKYFKKYLSLRKETIEDSTTDFWWQFACKLDSLDEENDKDKSEYLHFVLEQFNQAGYNGKAILISNILDRCDPSNYCLLIHTSIFDKMMFLEKTIEYLDKITQRIKADSSLMDSQSLLYNYGRIYYVNNMFSKALPYFIEYYEQSNENAVVNYLLGMSYLKLGETEKAKKIFSHNKELNDKSQMEYINRSIRQLKKL